ncbi:MAG: DJ-1/PfpI family protein [Clostridia bacterium]|nr:DJ-1/PfpI family protein [Clostridia bacterium]
MIYILLADGFEEVEALGCCDILRRAEIKTYLASIDEEYVQGSHKMTVKADMLAKDIDFEKVEGIVLPGGMPGTLNLQKNETVLNLIDYCVKNNKLIAAICAAPMILGDLELLNGKKATCFPGFEENLVGAEILSDFVVTDGNIITGKGAGAALMFGAAIADYFKEGTGKRLLKQVQHI